MKIAGIICEYNPFHNGHLYHINKTKECVDAVICVMSGHFVQRGGPSFIDKFSRAAMAVSCGADLVVELPEVFASRSAEGFAKGGISLLNLMGIVDYLSYGCESGNKPVFDETQDFKDELNRILQTGVSFPSARSKAFENTFGITISDKPNDVLAYEYNKAIKRTNSNIKAMPIKREFQEYHSMTPFGDYASASFIRKSPESADKYMPAEAYRIYEKSNIIDFGIYDTIVLSHLRTIVPSELSDIVDCGEGLENRIIECAIKAENYSDLIDSIKTKRYTRGRIERIIANSLLGIEKGEYSPEYIRVLALNETGRNILKLLKSNAEIPVITNLSKQFIDSKQLRIDIRAGNIYSLMAKKRAGGIDYTTSPVVI